MEDQLSINRKYYTPMKNIHGPLIQPIYSAYYIVKIYFLFHHTSWLQTLLSLHQIIEAFMQSQPNQQGEKLCFTWIASFLTMKTQAQLENLQKQLSRSILQCSNYEQYRNIVKSNEKCLHVVISPEKYDAALECLSEQVKIFLVFYYPANQDFDFSNEAGTNFLYIKDFENLKNKCLKLIQLNKRQSKNWPNFVAINYDFTGANLVEIEQKSNQQLIPFTCYSYWVLEKSKAEQLIKLTGGYIQNIEEFESNTNRCSSISENTEIKVHINCSNQYRLCEQQSMVFIKKYNIFKILETKKSRKSQAFRYQITLEAIDLSKNASLKEDFMNQEQKFYKYLYSIQLSKKSNRKPKILQAKTSIDGHKIKAKKFSYNQEIENAIQIYEELATMIISYYGQIHPQYANNLFYLGCAYQKLKKMKQATQAYLESLRIYKVIYEEMHPIFCPFLNDIAYFLQKIGDFNSANKIYRDSIKFFSTYYEKKHPNIAHCYYRIGCICQRVGNIPKAIQFYSESATEHYEKYLPDLAQEYAMVLKSLGQIYLKKGLTQKGQKYLQLAIVAIETKYGKKNSKYAEIVSNLAMTYLNKGNSKKALKILTQAFKIKKQLNQQEDIIAAGIHNNLGIIYQQQGDADKTKENYDCAIKKYVKLYDSQRYKDQEILKLIGNTYRNNKDFSDAAAKYQKYIKIMKEQGRTTEQLYAEGLSCLGKVYYKMGKIHQSVLCYEESLNIYEMIYGNRSLQYAEVNANLAQALSFQSKFYEAIKIMKQTVKTVRIIYGDFHNQYIEALNKLAFIYEKAEQYDRAYTVFEEAGRLYSIIYTERSFQFRGSQYNIAVCYRNRNYAEKSNSLYLWSMLYRYELSGEDEKKFRKIMNEIRGYTENRVKLKQNLHLFQSSLEKSLKSDGPTHKQFGSNLRSYGNIMRKLQNLELSMKLLQEARHIYKKLQMEIDYAKCLYDIAAVYVLKYEYEQAFQLLKKAVKIFGKKENGYTWYADDARDFYTLVQRLLFLERMQISPERQRQNMRKISIYF